MYTMYIFLYIILNVKRSYIKTISYVLFNTINKFFTMSHRAKKKVLLFGVCVLLIISVILAIVIVLIIQREGCDIKFNSLSELGHYRQVIIAQWRFWIDKLTNDNKWNEDRKCNVTGNINEKRMDLTASRDNWWSYKQAAVSTNGQECAQIGVGILKKNGSAVDAAIATLLCEGVASLHRYVFEIFLLFRF